MSDIVAPRTESSRRLQVDDRGIADTLRMAGKQLGALERMYERDPAVQTLASTTGELVECLELLLARVEQLEAESGPEP